MDLTGLVNNIITATASIDSGRKGFATRGKAEEGRISYEEGIALAMTAFKEAQATADPQIMILAEYTFLTQEFEFCEKSDKDSLNSLTQAIQYNTLMTLFSHLKQLKKAITNQLIMLFPTTKNSV